MQKKIFITGGAGYVGTLLVTYLLQKGFRIKVYDTFYYGCYLKSNKNLKIIKGDIRNSLKIEKECKGYEVFINLSCISNDHSFDLNSKLSKSINFLAFEPMVLAAKKAGIKRFIYASTSSVYGVSKRKNITESHPLKPITYYNKFKGMTEPLLFKHTDKSFEGVIFRPATVCGHSDRMRFDLSVNILTINAICKQEITVFGGNQLRPNLNIKDYCRVVLCLIKAPSKKIRNQIFNVGYRNLSIQKIAKIVKKVVEKKFKFRKRIIILKTASNDMRSYHINSNKIKKILNFRPMYNIEDAVNQICLSYKKNKYTNPQNNPKYYNVKQLIKLNVR